MQQPINSSATGTLLAEPCSSSTTSAAALCFESLFQTPAIGIAICDSDQHILRSNAALDRMFGYGQGELKGMCVGALAHPDDAGDDATPLRVLLAGENNSYQIERRYLRKDGSVLWGRQTSSVARASAGELVAVVETFEDIGEYKQAQEQLIEAQKMEAVGRLVGGVAHDFNNLLTGIMLYCDLLIAGTEKDARLRGHAREIRIAGEHGAALVQQLLTVARKHVVEPTVLSLNDTVMSMSDLLNRLIGEQIELTLDLEPALWQVRLDATQAQQVVLNLILNAKDAMPKGGEVAVSTRNCEIKARGNAPGRRIVSLVVSDTGCGMDPDTKAHLFEPFFTTKELGKGNGLGLATVYRIVHDSGGTIRVESEIERGCRVEIVLPSVVDGAEIPAKSNGIPSIGKTKR